MTQATIQKLKSVKDLEALVTGDVVQVKLKHAENGKPVGFDGFAVLWNLGDGNGYGFLVQEGEGIRQYNVWDSDMKSLEVTDGKIIVRYEKTGARKFSFSSVARLPLSRFGYEQRRELLEKAGLWKEC